MATASQMLGKVIDLILNPAILVIFSLGFLVFIWGLVQFLDALNKGGKSDDGKQHMLWGIVGMFIMVSVFGIISFITNTLGLGITPRGTYNPDMSMFNKLITPPYGTKP